MTAEEAIKAYKEKFGGFHGALTRWATNTLLQQSKRRSKQVKNGIPTSRRGQSCNA